MPEKVGHWKCLVNFSCTLGWGIGGDLELHCEFVYSCWELFQNKTSAKPSCISLSFLHIDGECFTASTSLDNHTTSTFYY